MQVRRQQLNHVSQCVQCGWRFGKKNILPWMLAAMLFMVLALLLFRIPIIGKLLLLFVIPIAYASGLLVISQFAKGKHKLNKTFKDNVSLALTILAGIVTRGEKVIPIIFLGAAMLLMGLLLEILGHLLGGTSFFSATVMVDAGLVGGLRLLGIETLLLVFYFFIAVAAFYAIPLTLFEDMTLVDALIMSFKAWLKNGYPFSIHIIMYALPFIVFNILLPATDIAGFIVLLILGILLLPLFMHSTYCSYNLMYRKT